MPCMATSKIQTKAKSFKNLCVQNGVQTADLTGYILLSGLNFVVYTG